MYEGRDGRGGARPVGDVRCAETGGAAPNNLLACCRRWLEVRLASVLRLPQVALVAERKAMKKSEIVCRAASLLLLLLPLQARYRSAASQPHNVDFPTANISTHKIDLFQRKSFGNTSSYDKQGGNW